MPSHPRTECITRWSKLWRNYLHTNFALSGNKLNSPRCAFAVSESLCNFLQIHRLFPQTPSFYYEHLFGPNWQAHARNLEKCVDAAYMMSRAPKLSRLRRPQWIPGHAGNSRGRGTAVDPVCSRRRTDVAIVSNSYEIYCQTG